MAMDEWRGASKAADWILDKNRRRYVISLGQFFGNPIDDLDWTAIERGVEKTNDQHDRWFEYPIGRSTLELARADGTSASGVVIVRLDLSRLDLFERGQVEMLTELMQG